MFIKFVLALLFALWALIAVMVEKKREEETLDLEECREDVLELEHLNGISQPDLPK